MKEKYILYVASWIFKGKKYVYDEGDGGPETPSWENTQLIMVLNVQNVDYVLRRDCDISSIDQCPLVHNSYSRCVLFQENNHQYEITVS